MSGIQGIPLKRTENPRWILGQVFMQVYYVLHDVDQKRVGLAVIA